MNEKNEASGADPAELRSRLNDAIELAADRCRTPADTARLCKRLSAMIEECNQFRGTRGVYP